MRWSIVGLIFRRELLDQARDRRTLFMIVVLPVLLYPLGGVGLMQLVAGVFQRDQAVGVVGVQHLPSPTEPARTAVAVVGLASAGGPAGVLGAAAAPGLSLVADPPLLPVVVADRQLRFLAYADDVLLDAATLAVHPLATLAEGRERLKTRDLDLVMVVADDFAGQLQRGQRPALTFHGRSGDDRSRIANGKLTRVLLRHREGIKELRLVRRGLPPDFDTTYDIEDRERDTTAPSRASNDLFRVLAQIFPFVLVMWSLAGALYPAVDLCAGEKERGTMETLLISPASREEIVWGKFLTIWLFSGVTAFLNLLSLGLTTWYFGWQLPQNPFRLSALFWGTILLLPLSAFFSAISLAVGVYARSSKEGQYYLMPLFLVTMPLIFLTLAPGVELNAFYSMVPVTGVALLLRSLIEAGTPPLELVTYFVPVLVPMVIYSWLALRWAIEQFQREEVLFREAERLDLGLWFRNLFREKEALPGAGMALFCFGLVVVLMRLGLSLPRNDASVTPAVLVGVLYLAAVATPPLMMAVLLTTRPLLGLRLRWCSAGDLLLALVLAGLLFVPGVLATHFIVHNVPALKEGLREHFDRQVLGTAGPGWAALAQLAVLVPLLVSVCEELAFRGLILTGLSRRFGPASGLLLTSFLFGLFQMNVFQFVPHFLLGLVLGLLTQRTGSLWPAIVFHAGYNSLVGLGLVVGPTQMPEVYRWFAAGETITTGGLVVAGLCLAAAGGLLALLLRRPAQVPEA